MNILNFSPSILDIIIEYIGPLDINNLFWTNTFFQIYIIRYLKNLNDKNNSIFCKFNYHTYLTSYNILNKQNIDLHVGYYYYLGYTIIESGYNDEYINNIYSLQPEFQKKLKLQNYINHLVNYHINSIKIYISSEIKVIKYYKYLLLYNNNRTTKLKQLLK